MEAPPVRFTRTTDGVNIAYTVVGSGPPLVLCWGTFNTHTALRWQSPGLRVPAEQLSVYFTVYEFDWRNTGSSTRGVPWGREEWCRDLDAVFSLFDEPANIIIFGTVAIPYVARHPERIRRLVTWNQAVSPARNPARAAFTIYPPLFTLEPDWARMFARKMAGDVPESTLREYEEIYLASDRDYQARVLPIVATWDAAPHLKQIAVPTLVVQRRDMGGGIGAEIGAEYAAQIDGAQLYLVKGSSTLMPGEENPIPRIVAFLTDGDEPLPGAATASVAGATGLSPREIEVLALLARGRTNLQIAAELGVAPSTIATHITHLFQKLEVSSRAEAAAWAVRSGLA